MYTKIDTALVTRVAELIGRAEVARGSERAAIIADAFNLLVDDFERVRSEGGRFERDSELGAWLAIRERQIEALADLAGVVRGTRISEWAPRDTHGDN